MKIKELCEIANIDFNPKHPAYSLNKLKQIYLLEQTGKKDYEIVRELTKQEQIAGHKLTQSRKLLEDSIYVQLSLSDDNTIRKDMKGFLELFNIVNNKYRYFSYDNMSVEKCQILSGFVDPQFENVTLCNYVDDVNPILYRMVKDIFRKMRKEMLIHVKEHLMFGKKYVIPSENGSDTVEYIRRYEADNNQTEEYMRLFKMFALEEGYDNVDKINNKVKKRIKRKVCKELGITYAYTEYEIVLNREGLKYEVDTRQDLQELKNSLNMNIVHKLNMSTQGNLKEYDQQTKTECSDFLIKC